VPDPPLCAARWKPRHVADTGYIAQPYHSTLQARGKACRSAFSLHIAGKWKDHRADSRSEESLGVRFVVFRFAWGSSSKSADSAVNASA